MDLPTHASALLTTGGVAVVVAVLLEMLVKRPFPTIPSRFYPLIALGMGILFAEVGALVLVRPITGESVLQGVLTGIVAGFISNGIYDNLVAWARPTQRA